MARDVPGIIGSLIFIAVGLLALYYSREFTPLGSVFPRTIASAMVLLSVVYIAVAWLRPKAPASHQPGSVWRRAALVAVMVAWALLLDRLGFLTTSVICFATLLVISNYDRWTPAMAVAYVAAGAAVLGSLYSIFRFVLKVPLPPGVLI
ncbi:tripartite tricarboxylate transporter TctB family protein [Pelomicrobium sp. G1]|uniref:tripartite tricarboxylate transporter TctB family protein n=1 Tax=unclassified Pelomicrobium TaxID=2815318 RepID=UPI003F767990